MMYICDTQYVNFFYFYFVQEFLQVFVRFPPVVLGPDPRAKRVSIGSATPTGGLDLHSCTIAQDTGWDLWSQKRVRCSELCGTVIIGCYTVIMLVVEMLSVRDLSGTRAPRASLSFLKYIVFQIHEN